MTFEVTILGCSSATPTADRHPSAQALLIRDTLCLIDCGEATQNQLLHYRFKHNKIQHIFISHLHGDHYLGLVGLLATINFQGREQELHIYGPEPLEKIISDHFHFSGTIIKFPLFFHPITDDKPALILETDTFTVETIILKHRIPTTGFIFREKNPARKINPEACESAIIPFTFYKDLQQGKDYITKEGKIIPNEILTFAGDKAKAYAYVSDTLFQKNVVEAVKGVDLLYHEATFLHELHERAIETLHTTAWQAGLAAKQAEVQKLLIGHFSARYRDLTPLLIEAQTQFENTFLAIEGEKFTI